ncbi:UDP-glucose 4-epimerase GalE [Oscillospiraceae bacterium MB08-C2-2]|nr:UDP-glucose 4-epimerase GalE [Oscillospiraceae bacterium MB08-C2-2]
MAILVTGGAGFIGSHTCVELLEQGYELVVLDNFSNSKPEAIARIQRIAGKELRLYTGDMLDEAILNRIFKENKIEGVIHFAGLKAVGESVRQPLRYYYTNITGTLNLCRVMEQFGCKRLVFSSSATVYGLNQNVPFREDYPLSTTNPYGATKLMIEDMLRDICAADPEWSVALLRYFNPIGAHASGLLGEDPNGIPNNLLPYICQVAVGKLTKLHVFGDDYDTPDGTGVRDYIHVVDLALGHLKAIDYVMDHSGATAINLGSGHGYSVLDVIKAFEEASGLTIPYVVDPRRAGDIAVCYADCTKALKELGWKSSLDLAQMCRDSWSFVQKNPDGM